MSIALLPGSYDPITLGHLDVIKRALALYDEVVVAVMNNDQKTYLFDLDERAHLASLATSELSRVRVIKDAGMLVDLFDRIGADVIVKGVRNEKDRFYEEEMAAYNLAKNPRAKTVFLEASDALGGVSSTLAREWLEKGRDLSAVLPIAVIKYLKGKNNESQRSNK